MNDPIRRKGMRIHFAGRGSKDIELSTLRYTHKLVKQLAKEVFSLGGGLVVTVGDEPVHKYDSSLPIIFDWTLVEALNECQSSGIVNWPESQGMPVVAVGLPKWKEKIPRRRKPLWEKVISGRHVELVQIKSELSIGGVLREHQAAFGDILVAIGGGPGVEHLAELYMSSRKPIIPLDIPLKTGKIGASERLSTRAMETPDKYFHYTPPEKAAAAYSALSLKGQLIDINEFARRFLDFISHLPKSKAFFVRLLNKKSPDFNEVEKFFRNIVEPVVKNAGYERFEVGTDASREPFLNVEIFETLYISSLIIADLTGLRQNCFMELGYALGLSKRVVLTAKEGTKLPFDSAAIPCHFWSEKQSDEKRRREFGDFMKKNINRRPLVS